jgi:hypothetical protein
VIAEVRTAIASTLQAALPELQVSPYILSNPTPPCAYLFPGEVDYDVAPGGATMNARGGDTWNFVLRAWVGEVGDIGAQQYLDALLEPNGDTSIKDIVETDYTLGGLVYNVTALTCSGYRQYQPTAGSAPVMGAEWTLQIFASGA